MRDDNQTKSKELLAQRTLLFAPKMEADVGYGVLTRLLERLGGGSVPSRRTPPRSARTTPMGTKGPLPGRRAGARWRSRAKSPH